MELNSTKVKKNSNEVPFLSDHTYLDGCMLLPVDIARYRKVILVLEVLILPSHI